MTATTVARFTPFGGSVPVKGTLPMAAAILMLKGQIVTVDADGNADVPTAGQDAAGIADSTVDNSGGAAGDLNLEISYGVFQLAYSGTAPEPGQVVYVLDNQTVTIDGSGGKGVAGFCTEIGVSGKCMVWMGPHVSGEIAVAADVETTADDALARAVLLATVEIPVPLNMFTSAAGVPCPAFADGTVNGLSLADSEALALRFNPSGDVALAAKWASFKLPDDLDATAAVEIHFLASRIGSSDTTLVITTTAFANRPGVAYDAGADLSSGNTAALDDATKVVAEYSVTLTGAAAGDNISFSIIPSAALDADDLLIHACWAVCTRDVVA